MQPADLIERGIVLLGCGKMGIALLRGWLENGLDPSLVSILEPNPSKWVLSLDASLNEGLPRNSPEVCVLAVKPQIMGEAIKSVVELGGGGTIILSIAAGTRIGFLEAAFGSGTRIVRAMPNTPAAIGHGISALFGNANASKEDIDLCESLLSAVGDTVRLTSEAQMDAVTAVSGSGPAYVFYLIECLAKAARDEGLPPDVALQLATSTVAGAGRLAMESDSGPEQLRVDVTSPGGTTAAALGHLMSEQDGLGGLLSRAVRAAVGRGQELGRASE